MAATPPGGYPVPSPAGSFSQLAVLPERVGQGLALRLLVQAENRLQERGVATVVIDTSCLAIDVIAWYERRGYIWVGTWQWSVTNYESVVLSKSLV